MNKTTFNGYELVSKTGQSMRVDTLFHDFLMEIQKERVRLKLDGRKKVKKSLTYITRLCFLILNTDENIDLLLSKSH